MTLYLQLIYQVSSGEGDGRIFLRAIAIFHCQLPFAIGPWSWSWSWFMVIYGTEREGNGAGAYVISRQTYESPHNVFSVACQNQSIMLKKKEYYTHREHTFQIIRTILFHILNSHPNPDSTVIELFLYY
jgi:hypothetical protein